MSGKVKTQAKAPTRMAPAPASFQARPFTAQNESALGAEHDASSLFERYLQRRALGAAHDFGSASPQLVIQPTLRQAQGPLTLGPVGDKYEQEADRVAAEVLSRINGSVGHEAGGSAELQTAGQVGMHHNGLPVQPTSQQVIQRAPKKRKAESEPQTTDKKKKLDLNFKSVDVSKRDISDHKQAATIGVKVQIGSERARDIKQLSEEVVNELIEQKDWYQEGRKIRTTSKQGDVTVMSDDPDQFKRALAIKYLIVHEEAEPRSGKSRAASDSMAGQDRAPAPVEAAYEEANKNPFYSKIDNKNIHSEFEVEDDIKNGKLKVTIVHKGPWAKGQRDPSQSGVMRGQNAKNYTVANHPNYQNDRDKGTPLDQLRKQIGGRYEWLHIIGSSLGGLNTLGNLVAGSYDANTKMIALEHRVALWGKQDYQGDFQPTPSNPITITAEAEVYPNTYVGKSIKMKVKHGTKEVASGDYDLDSQTVITRSEYEDEEKRVGSEIDSAR